MLNILFFGQLKEVLNTASIDLDWQQGNQTLNSVSKLRVFLQAKDDNWEQALQLGKVLVAVNQELVKDEHSLAQTDEVAFFPPVTGG